MSETIRKAASVVAAREGAPGPQVLVLERGMAHRFLPGYVVFPGGAVDEEDARAAERWFGDGEEADRAAAIRELAEEAGLILRAEGFRASRARPPAEDLAEAPPDPSRLHEIAHWVAPTQVPVRFDARYFAVQAPAGLEPLADGVEAVRAWWETPAELLEGWTAGRLRLYWPTYLTLTQLAACASVEEILAVRMVTREPSDRELDDFPKSLFWPD